MAGKNKKNALELKRTALAERIKSARLEKGLSFAKTAKDSGIPHTNTYQRIEKTGKVNPEYAEGLSRVLGIPVHELLLLPAKALSNQSQGSKVRIPVLDHSEISRLIDDTLSLGDLEISETTEIPFDLEHPLMTFALKVLDDSMNPRLKLGDLAIVDLAAFNKISDGSVVAALTGDGKVVLREYRIKRIGFELVSKSGETLDSKKNGIILLGPAFKAFTDI